MPPSALTAAGAVSRRADLCHPGAGNRPAETEFGHQPHILNISEIAMHEDCGMLNPRGIAQTTARSRSRHGREGADAVAWTDASQRRPSTISIGAPRRPGALPSREMTGEAQDEARADRDRERSAEAHWQVAEAGAEGERLEADQSDEQEDDWESEGGALSREPKQRG